MSTAQTAACKAPFMPITASQLRTLHAIGRRRGLTHEELREAAGVASLKQLSVTQAAELIDRLQVQDHRRDWQPDEPDRAPRGVIRNATARQRAYISHLIEQLGWDAEKAADWLRERHGIRDLAGGVFLSKTASEAVYQLEQAVLKDGKHREFDRRSMDV
jgi:hypothetical protein